MQYLLGIDIGTSGTKSVVFDCRGNILCQAACEYSIDQPHNAWAQQDPQLWWDAVIGILRSLTDQNHIRPEDILSISLSGQMHSLVLLDEHMEVVYPSLLWCDGRTIRECEYINQTIGFENMMRISGNPALTGFTAGKVLWVREHEPEVWSRVRHILLPKDYIRYRLTGVYCQDISDGSATNLFDMKQRTWSDTILNALELPKALLPPLVESSAMAGRLCEEAAKLTGLPAGIPIAAGGGDNMCAAVGTGVIEEGKAFTTLGTSGVVYSHSREFRVEPMGRIHTFCSAIPGQYTQFGASLAAGLCYKWFRNTFCAEETQTAQQMGVSEYDLLNAIASKSPIGSNRLLFLPYLMGERSPLLDSEARGAFIGLNASHSKGDMIRAVLEGVSFSQRHILETIGLKCSDMRFCGGGAKSKLWRQIMADVYGIPIQTMQSEESPALGAAIIAGVSAGVWPDFHSACSDMVHEKDTVLPIPENVENYQPYYELYVTLYPRLKQTFHRLGEL